MLDVGYAEVDDDDADAYAEAYLPLSWALLRPLLGSHGRVCHQVPISTELLKDTYDHSCY